MNKILVIDDDTRLRNLLGKFLSDHSFTVTLAKDAIEAGSIIKNHQFDLLVVDVMMPKLSGTDFTKNLRENGNNTPILMLTAMADVEDRIEGLESGADDYLSKPFEPKELLLRINNILKRNSSKKQGSQAICSFGNFQFNFEDLRLKKDNEFVHITDSEANILNILCKNLGKKVSRDDLSKACGDIDHRSIDVQITRLRKKIENNPKQPNFLQTARGLGYILQR
jgi:two-component system phosphate regulon response regulator OmpR